MHGVDVMGTKHRSKWSERGTTIGHSGRTRPEHSFDGWLVLSFFLVAPCGCVYGHVVTWSGQVVGNSLASLCRHMWGMCACVLTARGGGGGGVNTSLVGVWSRNM